MLKRVLGLLALLLVPATSALAFPDGSIYHTWGALEPTFDAFHKIALIFRSNDYAALGSVALVLGVAVGGTAYYVQNVTGARPGLPTFILPIVMGGCLWAGMFKNTMDIIIRDDAINQQMLVADVPIGVAWVALATNRIEKGFIDILDAHNPPNAKIANIAGGLNVNGLTNLMTANGVNSYVRATLYAYMNDCVLWEMNRPGSTLSISSLMHSDATMTELAKAVNPAVFTRVYSAGSPNGVSVNCTAAWNSTLSSLLVAESTYADALSSACASLNLNTATAVEKQRCLQINEDAIQNGLQVVGGTYLDALRQGLVAQILFEAIQHGDPAVAMSMQASRKLTASGFGTFITAQEWIPILKAVLSAVAIGIIPLLALFIPTPLCGRALSTIFGLFIFLCCWGVADAVVTSGAGYYYLNVMKEASYSGLGLQTILNMPDYNAKVLSMFGMVRSSAIMLAGAITFMLSRFGGQFMSGLSGNMMGNIQGAGSTAGAIATPEGRTQASSEMMRASSTDKWFNSSGFDFGHSATGGANNMAHQAGAGFGRGGTVPAFDSGFHSGAKQTHQDLGERKALGGNGAEYMNNLKSLGDLQGQESYGHLQGMQAFVDKFGGGATSEAARNAAATQRARNLALGGQDGNVYGAMARNWADTLKTVGAQNQAIQHAAQHFGNDYETMGAAFGAVDLAQKTGFVQAANAFRDYMGERGTEMSMPEAMAHMATANQIRFMPDAVVAAQYSNQNPTSPAGHPAASSGADNTSSSPDPSLAQPGALGGRSDLLDGSSTPGAENFMTMQGPAGSTISGSRHTEGPDSFAISGTYTNPDGKQTEGEFVFDKNTNHPIAAFSRDGQDILSQVLPSGSAISMQNSGGGSIDGAFTRQENGGFQVEGTYTNSEGAQTEGLFAFDKNNQLVSAQDASGQDLMGLVSSQTQNLSSGADNSLHTPGSGQFSSDSFGFGSRPASIPVTTMTNGAGEFVTGNEMPMAAGGKSIQGFYGDSKGPSAQGVFNFSGAGNMDSAIDPSGKDISSQIADKTQWSAQSQTESGQFATLQDGQGNWVQGEKTSTPDGGHVVNGNYQTAQGQQGQAAFAFNGSGQMVSAIDSNGKDITSLFGNGKGQWTSAEGAPGSTGPMSQGAKEGQAPSQWEPSVPPSATASGEGWVAAAPQSMAAAEPGQGVGAPAQGSEGKSPQASTAGAQGPASPASVSPDGKKTSYTPPDYSGGFDKKAPHYNQNAVNQVLPSRVDKALEELGRGDAIGAKANLAGTSVRQMGRADNMARPVHPTTEQEAAMINKSVGRDVVQPGQWASYVTDGAGNVTQINGSAVGQGSFSEGLMGTNHNVMFKDNQGNLFIGTQTEFGNNGYQKTTGLMFAPDGQVYGGHFQHKNNDLVHAQGHFGEHLVAEDIKKNVVDHLDVNKGPGTESTRYVSDTTLKDGSGSTVSGTLYSNHDGKGSSLLVGRVSSATNGKEFEGSFVFDQNMNIVQALDPLGKDITSAVRGATMPMASTHGTSLPDSNYQVTEIPGLHKADIAPDGTVINSETRHLHSDSRIIDNPDPQAAKDGVPYLYQEQKASPTDPGLVASSRREGGEHTTNNYERTENNAGTGYQGVVTGTLGETPVIGDSLEKGAATVLGGLGEIAPVLGARAASGGRGGGKQPASPKGSNPQSTNAERDKWKNNFERTGEIVKGESPAGKAGAGVPRGGSSAKPPTQPMTPGTTRIQGKRGSATYPSRLGE